MLAYFFICTHCTANYIRSVNQCYSCYNVLFIEVSTVFLGTYSKNIGNILRF